MNRVLRVLIVLILFELGVFLIVLPWSTIWEQNYFMQHNPGLIHIVLHPAMRGIISGLGFLDIMVAIGMLRRARPLAESGPAAKLPESFDQSH
jgi:hypothetical protein